MKSQNNTIEVLDLFDFQYENEVSEIQIQAALREIVACAKEAGNHHSFHLYPSSPREKRETRLSMSTINLLPELERRGYLEVWSNGRMCRLFDQYKDWHDPVDVAERFRQKAKEMLESGKTYYDLHQIRLLDSCWWINSDTPGLTEAMGAVKEEIAVALGIEHARKNPTALGVKIGIIKKHHHAIHQAIYENTKELTDWKDIRKFFESITFEIPSWDSSCFEYCELLPCLYHCVCLAQATDIEDVRMIVPHLGGMWRKKDGRPIIRYTGELKDRETAEGDPESDDEDWYEEIEEDDPDENLEEES